MPKGGNIRGEGGAHVSLMKRGIWVRRTETCKYPYKKTPRKLTIDVLNRAS